MIEAARPVHVGSGWAFGGLTLGCGVAAVSMFGFHQSDGKFGGVWGNFMVAALLVSYVTLAGLIGFAAVAILGHQVVSRVASRRAFWLGAVAGALGIPVTFVLGIRFGAAEAVLGFVALPLAVGGLFGISVLAFISVVRGTGQHGAA